jgi:DNA-binding transcriptional ArsR family regulator
MTDEIAKFTPRAMMVIEDPHQLKAFTDPLRLRVLALLTRQSLTNQQISDMLSEPHAKILYHIRFLLDTELIQLIDTQIKGGNVEKYYRAVAQRFDLRPRADLGVDSEFDLAMSNAAFDMLREEVTTSALKYTEDVIQMQFRGAIISPERLEAFNSRLEALIDEFWPPADQAGPDGPNSIKMRFATVVYRDPNESTPPEKS